MVKCTERILVVGAGVNGSICAVRLFDAGIDVTLLARGARFEFLKGKGVIIEDPFKNTRTVTMVPVIDALLPDDIYDYVLIVVRKNQVHDLLPVLAANKSPNLVFMVNNPEGPDEFVQALGAERVMLGFVFGAGKREGDIIRAISPNGLATPFGEPGGERTARLKRLVAILRIAGLNARPEPRMNDWLAAHAALVAPFAVLLIKHGTDNYALAKSKEDLCALVEGMRETLAVLRALGHRIVPGSTNIVRIVPRFILVPLVRAFLSARVAEIGGAWHCSQAPDEMAELARELKSMVERSGLSAPTLRRILG
jgi:2-dehydropantoate 2-reductase